MISTTMSRVVIAAAAAALLFGSAVPSASAEDSQRSERTPGREAEGTPVPSPLAGDEDEPEFEWVSVPEAVNPGDDYIVDMSFTDPSGVASVTASVVDEEWDTVTDCTVAMTGGSAVNGTYRLTCPIPALAPPGLHQLDVHFQDTLGNGTATTTPFRILLGGDLKRPVISDVTWPDTVPAGQSFTARFRVTDQTGATAITVTFWFTDGPPVLCPVVLTSGNPRDGTYAADCPIAADKSPGSESFLRIVAVDSNDLTAGGDYAGPAIVTEATPTPSPSTAPPSPSPAPPAPAQPAPTVPGPGVAPAPIVVPSPIMAPDTGSTTPRPTATKITVGVKSVKRRSVLRVDIDPDLSGVAYTAKILAKKGSRWKKVRSLRTKGARAIARVNLPKGSYRVKAPQQHGLKAGVSKRIALKR